MELVSDQLPTPERAGRRARSGPRPGAAAAPHRRRPPAPAREHLVRLPVDVLRPAREDVAEPERQMRHSARPRPRSRPLLRSATEHAGDQPVVVALSVGGAKVHNPRKRNGGSHRHPASLAQTSARWPPAEWPMTTARDRSSGYCARRTERCVSARRTSSSAPGQPPPGSPMRRYSTFHVAIPCARDRRRGDRHGSGCRSPASSRRGSSSTSGCGPWPAGNRRSPN